MIDTIAPYPRRARKRSLAVRILKWLLISLLVLIVFGSGFVYWQWKTDRPLAIERIRTLSFALNGINGWIDNLEQVSNRQYAVTSRASSQSFVHASLVSASPEPSPSELEGLIEKHCGRGSALQIQRMITAYLCVVSSLVRVGAVANTPAAKSDALLSLMRGTILTNPVCDPDEARSNLAKSIANLVP